MAPLALWAVSNFQKRDKDRNSQEESKIQKESKLESGVRESWQRDWQMLWTRRGELNMWLVYHRPLHNNTAASSPPWKRRGYHGYGEVTTKEGGSLLMENDVFWYISVPVNNHTHTVWFYVLSVKIILQLDTEWTFVSLWNLFIILCDIYVFICLHNAIWTLELYYWQEVR